MIYKFRDNVIVPMNDPDVHEHHSQRISDLNLTEVNQIIELCERLADTQNTPISLFGPWTQADVKATGGNIPLNEETKWLYDRMAKMCQDINDKDFKLDIDGFAEPLYSRKYEAPDDHFDWHIDSTGHTAIPRKLSVVLQLTDPREYEGGDFQFLGTRGPITTTKGQGIVTAFLPSRIHKVTPVTKGVRRALTMFLGGPNFR
jgi:hypothetical protein